MRADISERKAIAHYLAIRSARAMVRRSQLPWWDFINRRKMAWAAAGLAIAAEEIERGEHLSEQSSWIALLDDNAMKVISEQE